MGGVNISEDLHRAVFDESVPDEGLSAPNSERIPAFLTPVGGLKGLFMPPELFARYLEPFV